ncbi:ribonuclease H-like protein [Hysterangium stoloniferum]|nr:ribonuclease H-like protein [Hysterangium stoloniferum]
MRVALNPQAVSFVPVTSSTRYTWKNRTNAVPQKVSPFPMYSWQAASPGAVLFYIRDEGQANDEIAKLRGPLGFDLEWRVVFAKGAPERKASILQICDDTRILVIQLSAMNNFPVKVKQIVESSDVIKIGINIIGDGRKLQRDYDIVSSGLLELSHLANFVDPVQVPTKRMMSLQKVVEIYTGRTLCKGSVRTSNWEDNLTQAQLEYAANDAHAALTVYNNLLRMAEKKGLNIKPVPNGMGISYRSKSSSSSSSSMTSTTTATTGTTSQSGLKSNRHVSAATSVTSVDDSNYEYFMGGRTWTTDTFPQNNRPDSTPPLPSKPPVALKPLSPQIRRAYELWHVQQLEIPELCGALRSPDNPLTRGTVINYVLNALKSDRSLVYSRKRLRQLVKMDDVAWERHRWWLDVQ